MKRLTLLFFLITALTFGQEQEKKEAPWNVMYPEFMAEEAAEYFDEFNMLWSDESPINVKEGRLVAIAVSAAIRCEYCIAAQIEFAKKAVSTRFSEDKLKAITIDYKELLEPTRNEDADGSLWSTFNLLQEKVIHGMFEYNYGVKTRKVRKIKNFAQNQKVNQELFNMALEYVS